MNIDVCLCTYNPRIDVLQLVVRSIELQDFEKSKFSVILIDNNSTPPLDSDLLRPLQALGVKTKLVQEEKPGIFFARNRAMIESDSELLLWIDDDTELPIDYLSKCHDIASRNPDIGCFGGKLRLSSSCVYPGWSKPLHVYLAIVDRGDAPITAVANHWGLWEPPTAGAVVRRAVTEHYMKFVKTLPTNASIGQVGSVTLLRGEDSLLMRMAYRVGLACSYQPTLELVHHINNKRFSFFYLMRLLYGYGKSFVILENLLGNKIPRMNRKDAWRFFWNTKKRSECDNIASFVAMKLWNVGFLVQTGVFKKNAS